MREVLRAVTTLHIPGFLPKPKMTANGVYRGRFTCPDVQWTGSASDLIATFTITAGEIADAAESNMLWTDQDVQRGIQPTAQPRPPRELSLAGGYPDPKSYIFDAGKADDIVSKLLSDEQLFLNPLIWNARPASFEAYWNESDREVYFYAGRIYLPDSHHRHQAIVKAVKLWRESPDDYPVFSDSRQFKVELYFLSREDEGNYFFDKNQRPKPTANSKAYDLTTQDDLSILAKTVINKSTCLRENVNRVTDRLDGRNPHVITLSTLREMMKTFASREVIDAGEMDGLASVAAGFYDMLGKVRSELCQQPLGGRRRIREELIVDAAVMMHGYAALMRDYNAELARLGSTRAREQWRRRLDALSSHRRYKFGSWEGDLFSKRNPLWSAVGVVKAKPETDKITVMNTGGARGECGRVLRQLLASDPVPTELTFLARR
jgi:hypothetical protein